MEKYLIDHGIEVALECFQCCECRQLHLQAVYRNTAEDRVTFHGQIVSIGRQVLGSVTAVQPFTSLLAKDECSRFVANIEPDETGLTTIGIELKFTDHQDKQFTVSVPAFTAVTERRGN